MTVNKQQVSRREESLSEQKKFYLYSKHDFFYIHNFLRDDLKISKSDQRLIFKVKGIPPNAVLTHYFVTMSF
jgi:hypothetical protein